MRYSDIACPYEGTISHPYVAVVAIDPCELAKFQRLNESQPDVKILGLGQDSPDRWTIYAACASRTGRDALESGW